MIRFNIKPLNFLAKYIQWKQFYSQIWQIDQRIGKYVVIYFASAYFPNVTLMYRIRISGERFPVLGRILEFTNSSMYTKITNTQKINIWSLTNSKFLKIFRWLLEDSTVVELGVWSKICTGFHVARIGCFLLCIMDVKFKWKLTKMHEHIS